MPLLSDIPHVNDFGCEILVSLVARGTNPPVPIDLTGATVSFVLQRPDETTFTVNATVLMPEANGQAQYTTTATDFNQSGTWIGQAFVIDSGQTEPWHSDVWSFRVLPNLPIP